MHSIAVHDARFFSVLMLVCCLFPCHSIAQDQSFEQALVAAERFVPHSRQAEKEQLNDIISRYQKDPNVGKAKLHLVSVLIAEDTNDSVAEAAKLLEELNSPENWSEFQAAVTDRYLEFQLISLCQDDRRYLQRLERARDTAIAWRDAAKSQDSIVGELKAHRWLAIAEAQLGHGREAVKALLEAYDRCEAWHANGHWEREQQKSLNDVIQLSCAISNLASTLESLPDQFAENPVKASEVISLLDRELNAREAHFESWYEVRKKIEEQKAELPNRLRNFKPPLVQ